MCMVLPGPRDACDSHNLPEGDIHINISQIVRLCTAHLDIFRHNLAKLQKMPLNRNRTIEVPLHVN